MPILEMTCDNPDELLAYPSPGPVTLIQVESSATGGGAGYTNIGSVALSSGIHVYTFYDAAGTTSTWYRWYFSNAANSYPTAPNRQFSTEQQASVLDAYTTTQALRSFIRNGALTDAADKDLLIERIALEAAARAIDDHCGRMFRAPTGAASSRVFSARDSSISTGWYGQSALSSGWYGPSAMASGWYSQYSVDIDDVFDTSGATVAFDATGNGAYTQVVTGYRWEPANAPSRREPYRGLLFDIGIIPPQWQDGVQVTAKWGWTTPPAAVQEANLIQAARWMKRRDAPFGIAGSPEFGNELRLLPKLDPDLQVLLRRYRLSYGLY